MLAWSHYFAIVLVLYLGISAIIREGYKNLFMEAVRKGGTPPRLRNSPPQKKNINK